MYENGENGSNFGPITGTIQSHTSLPPSGTQYIEANGSGGCALNPSLFNMNFDIGSDHATFYFNESRDAYWLGVPPGPFSTYQSQSAGGATFSVTIAQQGAGSQDAITVVITD